MKVLLVPEGGGRRGGSAGTRGDAAGSEGGGVGGSEGGWWSRPWSGCEGGGEEEAALAELMFDGRHDTVLPSRQIDDVLFSRRCFNSKSGLTGGGGGGQEGRRAAGCVEAGGGGQ